MTTTSMSEASGQRRVIVGVDTHKDAHVAVAVDEVGGRLGSASFSADRDGYRAHDQCSIPVTVGAE